jgi:hypothetical protein
MAAQFGRRLRRGAVTTAVAAAAMAALTASQASGFLGASDRQDTAEGAVPGTDTPIDGGSPYHTDLPPLITPDKPGNSVELPTGDRSATQAGIPATVLDAYKKAEAALAHSKPHCNLRWELLAAIGKVESGQARGGAVDTEGTTVRPILGPQLNGNGFASITDTDRGVYDNDARYDRAVGPMQFIPSTWSTWGSDGNGDGRKDPNNVYDAALAAGRYLCAGDRDLSVQADLDRAILGYNNSREYLRTVLSWFEFYRKGTHEVPDGTGVLPVGTGSDADPGDRKVSGHSGEKGGSGGPKKPGGGSATAGSPTPTPAPTATETGTIAPTPGVSFSATPPAWGDPTATPTECSTVTASPSASPSTSGSTSPSASPSPSGSTSPSPSPSPSGSTSPSPSPSGSASPSPSTSPTGGEPSPCGPSAGAAGVPEPSPSDTGMAAGTGAAGLV